MPCFSRVESSGAYLPSHVMTNKALSEVVDTSDEWVRERTGIRQRHLAQGHETTSFMATEAAKQALERASLSVHDIDLIIVATTTPDRVFPSVACRVQALLGCHGCAAFDVQAACSGFIYALSVVDQFIHSGMSKNALVIGSEHFSQLLDWNDRSTCVLFGDGAGAVVVSACEKPGIISTHLHADGRHESLLCTEVREGKPYVTMEGKKVFKQATQAFESVIDETLCANQLDKNQIDWLIPHQANVRIIQAMAKKLDLPMSKVILTVAEHANTSAASIPLALDHGISTGLIQRGQRLMLGAFGAGFTWASALIEY